MLTVNEVAEKLKLNPQTVYRLIRDGHLKAHKLGRTVRITEESYRDYLKKTEM